MSTLTDLEMREAVYNLCPKCGGMFPVFRITRRAVRCPECNTIILRHTGCSFTNADEWFEHWHSKDVQTPNMERVRPYLNPALRTGAFPWVVMLQLGHWIWCYLHPEYMDDAE